MDKTLFSRLFVTTTRVSAVSPGCQESKNGNIYLFIYCTKAWKNQNKTKNQVDLGGPPRQCAYQAFISGLFLFIIC
jgi:hypothetical protein